MSMSLFLILAMENSPSSTLINNGAKELYAPIEIRDETDFNTHSGFLPVYLNNEKSGYEVYSINYSQIKAHLPTNESLNFENPVAFEFRWGSSTLEAATVFYTAWIISSKHNGVVFDPQSGQYISSELLKQSAETFLNME